MCALVLLRLHQRQRNRRNFVEENRARLQEIGAIGDRQCQSYYHVKWNPVATSSDVGGGMYWFPGEAIRRREAHSQNADRQRCFLLEEHAPPATVQHVFHEALTRVAEALGNAQANCCHGQHVAPHGCDLFSHVT